MARASEDAGWVADGNYATVRDLLWERADTVVWLDLPRLTTLRRVLLRTAVRLMRRTALWNGNRERWRTVGRASHPVRWTWQTHARHRLEYERRLAESRWRELEVVRLRTGREQRRWLDRAAPRRRDG